MSANQSAERAYEVIHVGARFTGLAGWGVMVRERADEDCKLVCLGCTREEAGELVRKLNAGHSAQ